jgi:hypothetical protein
MTSSMSSSMMSSQKVLDFPRRIMLMTITKEVRDAERREKARLRSERYRRARGIMPRKKAKQPWLAQGVSRFVDEGLATSCLRLACGGLERFQIGKQL